jgi:predicted RNA methylase
MSWDEAFSDRYEEWSAHATEDIAFYVDLALEADGPLVELAVGNGRVAVPVAQATGRPVIGIDTSPSMLEQARVNAAEAGIELDRALRRLSRRAALRREPRVRVRHAPPMSSGSHRSRSSVQPRRRSLRHGAPGP